MYFNNTLERLDAFLDKCYFPLVEARKKWKKTQCFSQPKGDWVLICGGKGHVFLEKFSFSCLKFGLTLD